MSSLAKALNILKVLSTKNGGVGVLQLSQEVELPPSTVHRLLNEMMKYNLVIQDEVSRQYMCGPGLLGIGLSFLRKNSINMIAHPYLQRCTSILNETGCLAILVNNQVICSEAVMVDDQERPLQLFMGVGKQLPLHASAAAWAIIAFLEEKQIIEMFKDNSYTIFSEATPQDFNTVRCHLEKTRQRGYAVCDGEMDVGVTVYSCPIYNQRGKVAASISIVGPRYRMTAPSSRKNIILTLADYANKISLALGCPESLLRTEFEVF